ncbi:TfoX/Sxy family protein [Bosea sp. 124]|uniref:TfoX/Sxy family protein n=1 Tax=Bosea sp. 124 TaxID=2135642 RepID=UPI000D376895|nr:TfoX/Sxy family protein [Bosea sp. 124]PTM43050.1 DNA transformation protein [Bosea sp. 124]
MDAEGIRELFAGIMSVRVRRMFGGHGIYDGGSMFALEFDGEIFLKADAESESRFIAAGSYPFVYVRGEKPFAMSCWRLPEAAFDDGGMLRGWAELAVAAARRRGAARPIRRPGSSPRSRPR